MKTSNEIINYMSDNISFEELERAAQSVNGDTLLEVLIKKAYRKELKLRQVFAELDEMDMYLVSIK